MHCFMFMFCFIFMHQVWFELVEKKHRILSIVNPYPVRQACGTLTALFSRIFGRTKHKAGVEREALATQGKDTSLAVARLKNEKK